MASLSPSGELEGAVRTASLPLGGAGGGFWGLTEPLLWIQLVAEGSLSQRRALGVAMPSLRHVNVESSMFQ